MIHTYRYKMDHTMVFSRYIQSFVLRERIRTIRFSQRVHRDAANEFARVLPFLFLRIRACSLENDFSRKKKKEKRKKRERKEGKKEEEGQKKEKKRIESFSSFMDFLERIAKLF